MSEAQIAEAERQTSQVVRVTIMHDGQLKEVQISAELLLALGTFNITKLRNGDVRLRPIRRPTLYQRVKKWFGGLRVGKLVNPNCYSGEDLHKVPFGLYEIFWKSGGSSLASVGNMHDGVRWIAPTNWTSADSPTGRMDEHANSIERMVLLYGQ